MQRASFAVAATLSLVGTSSAQTFDFVNVAGDVGLVYDLAPNTPGVAVGDFDDDGWTDILITGGRIRSPQVFRNNGALASLGQSPRWFVNVSDQVMPRDAEPASVSLFADLDNDGDQDIVSTRRYVDAAHPDGNSDETGVMYYENVGGTYVKGTADPDLARAARRHGGLALADLDLDSDLDIVFLHNGSSVASGGPGSFIRNNGLPNLIDDTSNFGVGLGTRRYFSVLLADFTGNMAPDLHAAIDSSPDFHCRNDGRGTFTNVSVAAGTTNTGADMGLAIGDIENDGDMDIYSTNINAGVLYVNDGTGTFIDEAYAHGVQSWSNGAGPSIVGWGTAFADFDNDGDQDLVFTAYGDPGHIYENDGTGHFAKRTATSGLTLRGHGLIPFDYDKDGDLDILLMRTGGMKIKLYENRSPALAGNNWIRFELEGTQSNRDGVGARVEAWTPDGAKQVRLITAGSSFKSGPPMNAHFGLGTSSRVRSVRVTWPSGTVQSLGTMAGGSVVTIVEP